jgi:hypothetical protein
MVRNGVGLKLDEAQDRVLPNAEITSATLRQRLKTVAEYDKNTGIWTPKKIGEDGYRGVEQLSREVSPEAIVAYQTASAAVRRLTDLGVHTLYLGDKTTASLGIAMTYLSGQMVSARKLMNLMKTAAGARAKRGYNKLQDDYYEKALVELQLHYKVCHLFVRRAILYFRIHSLNVPAFEPCLTRTDTEREARRGPIYLRRASTCSVAFDRRVRGRPQKI